ncbi:putative ABC transporter ATP-binding protein [bioreactor metagenome]|uniref:Putative ABC transporter ATP-binding protein n=1 Tax=bioreactor metagenome TaxID=1076179 RepID=A0A645DCC6_9ZZZZ
MIRRSDFYVFDDSFSALDFITDAKLRKALKETLTNSAIIIVAQRIGTILDADNIIVLDEGKIVETGTHQQLIQQAGLYNSIYEKQLLEKMLEEQE